MIREGKTADILLLIASRRRNHLHTHTSNAIKPIKISLSQPCSFILFSSFSSGKDERPKGGRWEAHTRTIILLAVVVFGLNCCRTSCYYQPIPKLVSFFRILLRYQEILFSSLISEDKKSLTSVLKKCDCVCIAHVPHKSPCCNFKIIISKLGLQRLSCEDLTSLIKRITSPPPPPLS